MSTPQTPPAVDAHAPSEAHHAVEGDPGQGAPLTPAPGLPPTCTDCPTPATYDTARLMQWTTDQTTWNGTWQPRCTPCALDHAATTGTPDRDGQVARAIATTLRPIGHDS